MSFKTHVSFWLLIFSWMSLRAQRIPLDAPLFQDVYFQDLLLNGKKLPSGRSFLIEDSLSFYGQQVPLLTPIFKVADENRKLGLLPFEQIVEYNSKHPYGWNNGSLLRSKGVQTLTRLGFWFKYDWLEIQYQPEIVYSEQADYMGFPSEYDAAVWRDRYINWAQIDLPEVWSRKNPVEFLPGQTQVNLSIGGVALGYSNRNFWMGPGIHQSLLMTNNARALSRVYIETEKPLNLGFAEIYLLVFGGIGKPSTELMPGYVNGIRSYFLFKDNRNRYVNGLSLAIMPKVLDGFTPGLNRNFQMYQDNAEEFGVLLPVFNNLFRENDNQELELRGLDQVISIYFQQVLKDANAIISLEYGRNDASLKIRDFIMSPSHSFAYNFSFKKYFKFDHQQIINFEFERTRFESNNKSFLRGAGSWYENSRVPHGYTNYGEIIGAGIGQGSNLTHLYAGYFAGSGEFSLSIDYLFNDLNFQVDHLRDKDPWTTTSLALGYKRILGRLLLDAKMAHVSSQNYQWVAKDEFEAFDDNPNNLHIVLKTGYMF